MALPFCGGGDDESDSTGQPDVPGVSGTINLAHAGDVIDNGASYNIPDNNDPASSNVALFSEQKDLMTINNLSDADVTINAITFTVNEGIEEEEFCLVDAESLKDELLVLADHVIPAGDRFDFYAKFLPVFSGERGATLKISYTDGSGSYDYTVFITGTGRPSDNAVPFSSGQLSLHKLLGHISTDEQATGMVADAEGNSYFLTQTKVVPGYDGFYYDLVFGRINADGSKGWFKIYSRNSMWEWAPDPGQNDETGGSPNAIAIDDEGYIYIAGSMSESNTNNNNSTHVMKVDSADGTIVWDKIWRPEWTDGSFLDRMGCNGYAVAVAGDYVFVTGATGDGNVHGVLGSNSSVLLLGLNKGDGSMLFHQAVDVAPTYNDRGHAVIAEADGSNVYVGGLTNGRGLLLKFSKTNSATPEVAWVKKLDMGTGSNVYGLDIDGTDVYLALDRRGASTFFSLAKVDGATGDVTWAKTYQGNAGDNNNCNVVKVFGDHVYAGGRIGFSVMDAQMGDGFILRLNKADGAYDWAGVYYTGKSPNEIEEHRVKGIAVVGKTMYLGGQVYTGSTGDETYRYDGYWYDGLGQLEDFNEVAASAIADFEPFEPTNGELRNVADHHADVAYDDLPEVMEFMDAVEKKEGHGASVDEEFFWMKMELN